MQGKFEDVSGQVFGQLTVLHRDGDRGSAWVCLCSCGRVKTIFLYHLKAKVGNRTVSCGHVQEGGSNLKHGESHTPLHSVWLGMRTRTRTPTNAKFHLWGGRGIKIEYQPWLDAYEPFRDWARANGYKQGLTLERRDNEKGYSPDNCYFATNLQQSNNRRSNVRLTAFGETKTVLEWSRDARCWCNSALLYIRARKNKMSHQEMITRPSSTPQFPKYSIA